MSTGKALRILFIGKSAAVCENAVAKLGRCFLAAGIIKTGVNENIVQLVCGEETVAVLVERGEIHIRLACLECLGNNIKRRTRSLVGIFLLKQVRVLAVKRHMDNALDITAVYINGRKIKFSARHFLIIILESKPVVAEKLLIPVFLCRRTDLSAVVAVGFK